MRKILVVANETLVSSQLTKRIHEMQSVEPIEVLIVVPAYSWVPDERDPIERATRNLEAGLDAIRRLGIEASGRVGDQDPMAAVASMIDAHPAVEMILVSTLPLGSSRWLRMDLPHRVGRRFKRVVEHVVGTPNAASPEASTGPLQVLLVEDNEADIALARIALDGTSHDVDLKVARDGAEAISYLQVTSPAPALILVDLKMPVMDGHTMLEHLGTELGKDALNDLNVVIVSSSASDADRTRAHSLGARAYVVKDPDFDQFQAVLSSLLTEVAQTH